MQKRLIVAGLLALSSPCLAGEDEMLAREYLKFHAARYGYDEPTKEVLDISAPNMVAYCANTPVAQMTMLRLKGCEEFETFKNLSRDRLRKLLND